jgi:hypothetical protein
MFSIAIGHLSLLQARQILSAPFLYGSAKAPKLLLRTEALILKAIQERAPIVEHSDVAHLAKLRLLLAVILFPPEKGLEARLGIL